MATTLTLFQVDILGSVSGTGSATPAHHPGPGHADRRTGSLRRLICGG